ncbi:HIT-like protein [Ascobolus immersus RN42]|uniref:HIT-like protein n=1 Tax=Ascobolus immersus RN42 TaxID=1160509 RepID=A0A3N4IFK6_ASCIM|nr:HIT-like protein [Ascobolus immersus RN42]
MSTPVSELTTSNAACPFCAIANLNPPESTTPNPETPHLLRKTDSTLTFLDILPLTPLHTLVTPRGHYPRIEDVPPAILAAVIQEVQLVTRCLHLLGPTIDYNVVCNNGESAGQVVPHVHFHVVPRTRELQDGGKVTGWERTWRMFAKGIRGELDLSEVEEIVGKVKQELEKLGNAGNGRDTTSKL